MIGDPDVQAHFLGQLHLDGRAAVGFHPFRLAAVPLHPMQRQTANLGPEERLQDVVQLLGPDDRDDELHAAP